MSFDWNKYLIIAKTLAQNPAPENSRCAISRAYYAVFNIACRKINLKGNLDKHSKLIGYFKDLDVSVTRNLDHLDDDTLMQIGDDLAYLRSKRNWADYDNSDNSDKRLVENVISKSELIIGILNQQ